MAERDSMTTWSVLVEARFDPDDDPGEAEVELLTALEELGADAPATGGGGPDRLAARFCVEAEHMSEAVDLALTTFRDAVAKAAVDAEEPSVLELMPFTEMMDGYGVRSFM